MPESIKKPLDLKQIFPQVADIRDDKLRQSVFDIWDELWRRSAWTDVQAVPTAPQIPYPTIPHNQCILDMALSVADFLEKHHGAKIDRDVLIAAAILQDASKVIEYTPLPEGKASTSARSLVLATDPRSAWGMYCACSPSKNSLNSAIAPPAT